MSGVVAVFFVPGFRAPDSTIAFPVREILEVSKSSRKLQHRDSKPLSWLVWYSCRSSVRLTVDNS